MSCFTALAALASSDSHLASQRHVTVMRLIQAYGQNTHNRRRCGSRNQFLQL